MPGRCHHGLQFQNFHKLLEWYILYFCHGLISETAHIIPCKKTSIVIYIDVSVFSEVVSPYPTSWIGVRLIVSSKYCQISWNFYQYRVDGNRITGGGRGDGHNVVHLHDSRLSQQRFALLGQSVL